MRTIRILGLVLGAALMLNLAAVACDDDGGGDGEQTAVPTEATPEADIPELEDGVLQVGSDIAYAPIEFFEEGSDVPMGLDIDLANALGDLLGVEVEFANLGFDPLIPSLQGGEIDIIMSAMTITEERSQQIDFIPYLNAGTGILVVAGNPEGIAGMEDLCGLTVAVQIGTIQADQIDELNETTCADNPIDKQTFDENPLAVEQLRSGAADAVLADDPVVVNDARLSEGELEVAAGGFESAPYGIGVRKDSTALNEALSEALQTLIENGTYAQILETWNLSSGAIQ